MFQYYMNLYVIVSIYIILLIIITAFVVRDKFNDYLELSNCPIYPLIPQKLPESYYDPYVEISNDDFNTFLSSVFKTTEKEVGKNVVLSSVIDNYHKQLYGTHVTDVLHAINQNWKSSTFNREKDNFLMMNDCLSSFVQFSDKNGKKYSEYIWNIYIYRDQRNYGFHLGLISLFSEESGMFTTQHVTLIGNIPQNDIIQYKEQLKTVGDVFSYTKNVDSEFKPIIYSPKKQADYLIDWIDNKKKILKEMGYVCYGQSEYTREKSCESKYDTLGRLKQKVGSWDKQCSKNEDCPYWLANKNYANTRGGCNEDGWCEMPVNVNQISFTKYSENKPFCYNCDAEDDPYMCCENQKNKNRMTYGLMASPDYAFAGDVQERQQNISDLLKRDLLPASSKRLDLLH